MEVDIGVGGEVSIGVDGASRVQSKTEDSQLRVRVGQGLETGSGTEDSVTEVESGWGPYGEGLCGGTVR